MRLQAMTSPLLLRICQLHGLTMEELRGGCHAHRFVEARRHAALILAAHHVSQPKIGRMLGYRDHSTICRLLKRKVDPVKTAEQVDAMTPKEKALYVAETLAAVNRENRELRLELAAAKREIERMKKGKS